MDFFGAQRIARRNTGLILMLYAVLVAALSFGATCAIGYVTHSKHHLLPWFNKYSISGGILFFVLLMLGTWYHYYRLSSSPLTLMDDIDADRLSDIPSNKYTVRLQNVVDEMSVSSGLKRPVVFLLEDDSINALACGSDSVNVVGVTWGAATRLTRDELQAVVAHEIGHLVGKDSQRSIIIAAMIATLEVFSDWGLEIMQGTRWSRRGNQIAFLGFALFIIGLVGRGCANILMLCLSRQREYHADALSAQYTRLPEALASALAKIEGHGAEVENVRSRNFRHMFFQDSHSSWFSTHPSTASRIEALVGGKGFVLDAPEQEIEEEYPRANLRASTPPSTPSRANTITDLAVAVAASSNVGSPTVGLPVSSTIGALPLAAVAASLSTEEIQHVTESIKSNRSNAWMYILACAEHFSEKAIPLIDAHEASLYNSWKKMVPTISEQQRFGWLNVASATIRVGEYDEKHRYANRIAEALLKDGSLNLMELALMCMIGRRLEYTSSMPIEEAIKEWSSWIENANVHAGTSANRLWNVIAKLAELSVAEKKALIAKASAKNAYLGNALRQHLSGTLS